MNEELVNKKIENLKEEMLSKQMEDFSSMLDNYKTNLETLERNIDTYLNEKKTIVLFDGKEVVLNITSEELSRLSKEELYSLILQTNNRLMECKQYLEDCFGRISKIKISDIYILTSKLNFERYNLFRKVKKEYPHLSDEIVAQKIGYPGIKKFDKDLINKVKVLKAKVKNIEELVVQVESLKKMTVSILQQRNKDEIMMFQPSINNGEFVAVYEKEDYEGIISSKFVGITTKQEFEFLREKGLMFMDISVHSYTRDQDITYELQEPKTLIELSLAAKYIKELQQMKDKPYEDEIGTLSFGDFPTSFAIEITKRELLERGFYYSFENNWNFVKKLKNKDRVEEPKFEERKKRNI